ncbi:MAG: transcriptional repressor NrdR [Spirochaetaceae bacterium]|nr:transcriptional repressor NrdR [Spirochaetaceae bacterium]
MKCPKCGSSKDKVLESRQNTQGSSIRRRRECLECGYRFTSYEKIEEKTISVIKKDGRSQQFDIKKIERGIRTATDKLNISEETLTQLLDSIEDAVEEQAGHDRQIKSSSIGEETLRQLSLINTVAYVRFAAVYRAFEDLDQFILEIERLNENKNELTNKNI